MTSIDIRLGDSRDVLKTLADNSIDSVVTDPPYALVSIGKRFGSNNAAPAKAGKSGAYARASAGFMGKKWDTGETAFAVTFWAEVMRVLKPGGHVIAFSGTRTYHRLAVAIEDAGFEIRDMVAWLYGSGFPKSHDVAKQIDKSAGHWRGRAGAVTIESQVAKGTEYERTDKGAPITPEAQEWQGWGTALKPALEPIVLARKPLTGTVAANVIQHGTGALNIDASRIHTEEDRRRPSAGGDNGLSGSDTFKIRERKVEDQPLTSGRWPANVILENCDEVSAGFPVDIDGVSASRYFYTPKADATERLGTKHPTVKPTDLMAYLVRLVTPPGGTVLDPFAGSGSTGVACVFEGFNAVLIEREPEYFADIERRIEWAKGEGKITATQIRKPAAKIMDGDLFPDAGA